MNYTLQPETPYQCVSSIPSKSLSLQFTIQYRLTASSLKTGLKFSLIDSSKALYVWIEDNQGVLRVRTATKTFILPRSKLLTKGNQIKIKCLVYVTGGRGFLSMKSQSNVLMTQSPLDALDGLITASIFNESSSDIVTFSDLEILDFAP